MANKNIKGITIAVGGDTTGLEKALKTINDKAYKLKSELKEVEKALKLNPKNTELLAQKQEILAESIKNTKDKLNSLKEVQEKVNERFVNGDITDEQYREFQRTLVTTESELNNLENTLNETNDTIAQNNNETEKSNKKHKTLKEGFHNLKTKVSELKEKLHNALEKLKNFGEMAKKVATSSLKALQTGIQSVGKVVETGISGFTSYVKAITAVSSAVAGFAVKNGASFETSMSKVQALSGATAEDFEKLEQKAKEMGASTSKTASESADALGYMALAGWNTTQMLEGLEPILRASEAGAMDLATCSDLVTDSMASLGKGTEELSHYLDVVTKAQSSSNTSMQQMLEAYVVCGGTMKNLEVPLETSASLIGVLANRGIKGSEAGTSLNSVLINLMGASGKASEALDLLGISMYENGQRKDIVVMLNELNAKLAECDEESRDTFTAMIGGKTQMDTLQALLTGVSEEYGDLNEKLNNCNGFMLETAKTMQDNVQGAFVALQSAVEGLGIAIYDYIKTPLKESIGEITGYVSTISESIQKDGTYGFVIAISRVKKQIIESVLNAVPDILQTVSESSWAFNKTIYAVIETLIATLPQIFKNIVPEFLENMFSFAEKIIEFIPQIVPILIECGTLLITGIVDGMLKLSEKLTGVLPRVFRLSISALSKTIPEIFSTGTEILTTLISGIVSVIPMIIPAITKCSGSIVSTLINAVTQLLPAIVQTGMELLVSLLNGIVNALPQLITTIVSCIMSLIQTIMDNLPQILQAGVDILLSIIQGIISLLPELVNTVFDLVIIICDTVFSNLDKILDVALEIIIVLIRGITENLPKLIEYIPKITSDVLVAVVENFDKIIEVVIQVLSTVAATLVSNTPIVLNSLLELGRQLLQGFKDINWSEIGDGIINGILTSLNSGIDTINGFISSLNINLSSLGIEIPTLEKWDIPMLAKGGVLSSGSAIVGEAGAELVTMMNGKAVVQPLTNSNTTNNTFNQYTGGNITVPVYLYPDSQAFNQAVITAQQMNSAVTGGR